VGHSRVTNHDPSLHVGMAYTALNDVIDHIGKMGKRLHDGLRAASDIPVQ